MKSRNLLLLVMMSVIAGCEEEAPKGLAQKLDGASEVKELCAWLKENNAIDKDENVRWSPLQSSEGAMRFEGYCGSSPSVAIVLSGGKDKYSGKILDRELKITLAQDTPKGGSLVWKNVTAYGTEHTARTSVSDVDVRENGSNELSITFSTAGKLKEKDKETIREHRLSFEGALQLLLRGKKSGSFVQRSVGDYDSVGAYDINFLFE